MSKRRKSFIKKKNNESTGGVGMSRTSQENRDLIVETREMQKCNSRLEDMTK